MKKIKEVFLMTKKSFQVLAYESLDNTQKGVDYLIQVEELLQALKNISKTKNYREIIEEIIEKEKIAVELISKATLIQRQLMQNQQKTIENLIIDLSKP